MNPETHQWMEEVSKLSAKDSSRMLGFILGISPSAAADLILERSKKEESTIETIAKILNRPIEIVARNRGPGDDSVKVRFSDVFPPIETWLRNNDTRSALLLVEKRFAYVAFGQVLKGVKRGRVSHVIFLD